MQRKKKTSFFKIALFSFFLFLFIGLNIFTSFSDTVKNLTLTATAPMQNLLFREGSSIQRMMEVFRGAGEVEEEIRKLRKENKRLSVLVSLLWETGKENKDLREALNVSFHDDPQRIFSEIIGKDIAGHHLIIRHDEKIEEGSPVVSPEGALVGVVSETYGETSYVKLITSGKSSFEVKVQNEDEPIGLLKGEDGKGLLLDLLPKEKKIEEGDRVVTLPGNDIGVRGIYIGEIEEVIKSDVEAFSRAKVSLGFDIRYLDFLFVLKK